MNMRKLWLRFVSIPKTVDDYKENSIIAGVPAKSVKDIGRWEP